jgi:hypothetical protein
MRFIYNFRIGTLEESGTSFHIQDFLTNAGGRLRLNKAAAVGVPAISKQRSRLSEHSQAIPVF